MGEGNGTPLKNSCLENPMDGGAWWATVHGLTKSQTQLSDFTFNFHFNALEKEMATHSSVLAWRIPETGEPGGLPSMGSHRVGHNWNDLAAAAAWSFMIPPRKDKHCLHFWIFLFSYKFYRNISLNLGVVFLKELWLAKQWLACSRCYRKYRFKVKS